MEKDSVDILVRLTARVQPPRWLDFPITSWILDRRVTVVEKSEDALIERVIEAAMDGRMVRLCTHDGEVILVNPRDIKIIRVTKPNRHDK